MKIKYVLTCAGAKAPAKATEGSAAYDLFSPTDFTIEAGEFTTVFTGLKIAIPEGFEGQIRPRSGNAAKFGITILNAPGTIDSDYRGEIGLIMINHSKIPHAFRVGDRLAQLVISRIEVPIEFSEVKELDSTSRGEGGFGSTGR